WQAARGLDRGQRDDAKRDVEAAQDVPDGRVLPVRRRAEGEEIQVAEDPPDDEGQRQEGKRPADGEAVAHHQVHRRSAFPLTMRATGQKRPTDTSTKPLGHASTESHPRESPSERRTW